MVRVKTKRRFSIPRRGGRGKPRSVRTPRSVRNSRVTKVPGITGLIAKGVRTLTSWLPGQSVIKPMVDFGLKTFGFAETFQVSGSNAKASVKVIGVGANFVLCIKDVVFNDARMGARTNESAGRHNLITNYSDGRLLHLRLRAERSDPASSSVGRWGMAFLPFRSAKDKDFYRSYQLVPSFRDLDDIPGAAIGSARSLEINFRVKQGRDGILAMPMPLDQEFGVVYIAYDNLNRAEAAEVAASEFGCIVTVSGAAAMSRPQPFGGYSSFSDSIVDNLDTFEMTVVTNKAEKYNITKTSGVTKGSGLLTFSAAIVEVVHPNLNDVVMN